MKRTLIIPFSHQHLVKHLLMQVCIEQVLETFTEEGREWALVRPRYSSAAHLRIVP
jgi:hypothetical protein